MVVELTPRVQGSARLEGDHVQGSKQQLAQSAHRAWRTRRQHPNPVAAVLVIGGHRVRSHPGEDSPTYRDVTVGQLFVERLQTVGQAGGGRTEEQLLVPTGWERWQRILERDRNYR